VSQSISTTFSSPSTLLSPIIKAPIHLRPRTPSDWPSHPHLHPIKRSKARFQMEPNTGVTFSDVAGVDEAKQDFMEVRLAALGCVLGVGGGGSDVRWGWKVGAGGGERTGLRL
jgi:hypothetical protein